MPRQLFNLRKLQVLDLSQNHVSGTKPSDMGGDAANYQDEVSLIWKGIDSRYKNALGLIGKLSLLNSLDLLKNLLTGGIPESFSQLNSLGVLDLTNKNLSGEEPVQVPTTTVHTELRGYAYFLFLNDIGDEINILAAVNVAKLQRQFWS
ncbi:hypothetical protein WN943_010183 [Citrus x changshan-huyou]